MEIDALPARIADKIEVGLNGGFVPGRGIEPRFGARVASGIARDALPAGDHE